jgi:hypothetical protein
MRNVLPIGTTISYRMLVSMFRYHRFCTTYYVRLFSCQIVTLIRRNDILARYYGKSGRVQCQRSVTKSSC